MNGEVNVKIKIKTITMEAGRYLPTHNMQGILNVYAMSFVFLKSNHCFSVNDLKNKTALYRGAEYLSIRGVA